MDRVLTRASATQELAAAASKGGAPDAKAVAEALVELLPRGLPQLPPGTLGLMFLGYVVRDDDLRLVETLMRTASLTIPALLAPASDEVKMAAAVMAFVCGGFEAARSARKRGVWLDPLSFQILKLLKAHPKGLTTDELLEAAGVQFGSVDREWFEELLGSLASARSIGGVVVKLVEKDGNGRWGTTGV